MKPRRILRASLGLLLASGASAQGVFSQIGGFSEQAEAVPAEAASAQPSPLSLFLQQAPPLPASGVAGEPTFQVAAALPVASFPAAAPASAPPVTPPVEPAAEHVPVAPLVTGNGRPKGMLTLRSMRVANPGAEGSKIFFGASSEFAMGTDSAGNFQVQQASAVSPIISLDNSNTLHLGSSRVEALTLDAKSGISVRGVKQWQLVHSEDFSEAGAGWNRPQVSQCAGVFMLGGFCKLSNGEVNKTFSGLPAHKQLRVVATYHFIDRWIGETGYMKLDVGMSNCPVTVWSERHAQQEAKNGLSLCGDAGTPEGKFAAPVDVTVPHSKDTVAVTFGSTMGDADPCDESWGISNLEIYVRN